MKKTILYLMLLCGLAIIPTTVNAYTSDDDDITVPRRNSRGRYHSSDIYYHMYANQWGLFAGTHSGQLLNSSYGQLVENGLMKSKLGFSVGTYAITYPFIAEIEYTNYNDVIGNVKNRNKGISAYLSWALFPWFFTINDEFRFIPDIGIGLQRSVFKTTMEPVPDDMRQNVVYQGVYKLGFIMSILVNDRNDRYMTIIGNYYSSLLKKDNPHAIHAFTVGVGISLITED